jgi:hypothetical protein
MSTYNVKMEGSEQERQLLEVLRDHGVDVASDFRLLVQKQDGAWDVTLSSRRAQHVARNWFHIQRGLGQHRAIVDLSPSKRLSERRRVRK